MSAVPGTENQVEVNFSSATEIWRLDNDWEKVAGVLHPGTLMDRQNKTGGIALLRPFVATGEFSRTVEPALAASSPKNETGDLTFIQVVKSQGGSLRSSEYSLHGGPRDFVKDISYSSEEQMVSVLFESGEFRVFDSRGRTVGLTRFSSYEFDRVFFPSSGSLVVLFGRATGRIVVIDWKQRIELLRERVPSRINDVTITNTDEGMAVFVATEALGVVRISTEGLNCLMVP